MNDNRYPKHLATTHREWKSRKRSEIREVLREGGPLDELMCGCVYTPAYVEIKDAIDLLRRARKKMSVKEWGR